MNQHRLIRFTEFVWICKCREWEMTQTSPDAARVNAEWSRHVAHRKQYERANPFRSKNAGKEIKQPMSGGV
jgi:hypothetical protein